MKLKRLIPFCFIFFGVYLSSFSQVRAFYKLSKFERIWVIKHPFIAKRTFQITKNVLVECRKDQIMKALDTLANGGKLDAFRHIFWMATVSQSIGPKRAFSLGLAHERSNYLQFKKHQLEESELPDYPSCLMDSLNNLIGIELGISCSKNNHTVNSTDVVKLINSGNCFVIKRDSAGNYLTCDDKLISHEMLRTWKNEKCILKLKDIKK